ncbi:dephospho-CoA kinase [Candidatus Raskinella chloraquaticus]|uniref:Dephospho-CoA kinase n=1 Tax=Candidatus Raskinella chloraquaticus TaxID=1951219 RepID=A0A1W9HYR8_9HYPH|nr:MAG: dephospho-CoA kinase [Proteobacteria bacterium SG_bin8]
MIVLGLTGSIGMGKSTTAGFFREAGIAVHDADQTVHDLYHNEAVPVIASAFPETIVNQRVDRDRLRQAVIGKPEALATLESLIHPLVHDRERMFLARQTAGGAPLAVLDIPLLFETRGDRRCHAVLVVTAPPDIQRQRVMARRDMTSANFEALLAKQMPDAEKRQRAHFVIDTSRGLEAARRGVHDLVRLFCGRS